MEESTWVAKESPEALVSDFEKGIEVEIQKESFESAGQIVHTLSLIRSADESLTRPQKRRKMDKSDLEAGLSG